MNRLGLTLMEVLVTMGVSSIVLVAVLSASNDMYVSKNTVEAGQEITAMMFEINGILNSPRRCSAALRGTPSVNGTEVTLSPTLRAGAADDKLSLSSVRLQDITAVGTHFMATIEIIGEKRGRVYLPNNFTEFVRVVYSVDSANNIQECAPRSNLSDASRCTAFGGIWTGTDCDYCTPLGGTLAGSTCVMNSQPLCSIPIANDCGPLNGMTVDVTGGFTPESDAILSFHNSFFDSSGHDASFCTMSPATDGTCGNVDFMTSTFSWTCSGTPCSVTAIDGGMNNISDVLPACGGGPPPTWMGLAHEFFNMGGGGAASNNCATAAVCNDNGVTHMMFYWFADPSCWCSANWNGTNFISTGITCASPLTPMSPCGPAGTNLGLGYPVPYPSDQRLKTDIQWIGEKNGFNIYRFKYSDRVRDLEGFENWYKDLNLDVDKTYYGVLAQEVLGVRPDAVVKMPNGYYAVRYDKLNIEFGEYR